MSLVPANLREVLQLPLRLSRGALGDLFPGIAELAAIQAAESRWRFDDPEHYCHRCGASTAPGAATPRGCSFCFGRRLPWQRLVRLGPYRAPLSDWILALKFGRQWAWGPWLGRQLALRLPAPDDHHPIAVCPVPLHWWRRMSRGYNQAQLIARTLASDNGWPLHDLLRRRRYDPPQTSLPPSRRLVNVRGSMAVAPVDLHGWDVWLVDDVKTTGATLSACARLLKRAGAHTVNVAVIAVADPKGRDFKAV